MKKITISALLIIAFFTTSSAKNEVKNLYSPQNTYGTSRDSREGVCPIEMDTAISPNIEVRKAKPNEMPKLEDDGGFKQNAFFVKITDTLGISRVDTVMQLYLNDSDPQWTEESVLRDEQLRQLKTKALEDALISDGLIKNRNKYSIILTAKSLLVNDQPVEDKALIKKYFIEFMPESQNLYKYSKNWTSK